MQKTQLIIIFIIILLCAGGIYYLWNSVKTSQEPIKMGYYLYTREATDSESVYAYAYLPRISGFKQKAIVKGAEGLGPVTVDDIINFDLEKFEMPINNYVRYRNVLNDVYGNCFPSTLNKKFISLYCVFNGRWNKQTDDSWQIHYRWFETYNKQIGKNYQLAESSLSLSSLFKENSDYLDKLKTLAKGNMDVNIGDINNFNVSSGGLVLFFDQNFDSYFENYNDLDALDQIVIPWTEIKDITNDKLLKELGI